MQANRGHVFAKHFCHDDLSEDKMAELKEAFAMFDKNSDSLISLEELRSVLRALGQEPTEDELQTMMKSVDLNQNGVIEFEEFVTMMRSYLTDEGQEPAYEEELKAVFKVFDRDGNGFISFEELKTAMINLGERLTNEELKAMMDVADTDDDGQIDFSEFLEMMRKK